MTENTRLSNCLDEIDVNFVVVAATICIARGSATVAMLKAGEIVAPLTG